ncbi:MAG: hypothetical protein GEU74_10095 [Nitriliruptorales bacterium]|nr:hypothetical protein [Nitriliruptorales bacterium]
MRLRPIVVAGVADEHAAPRQDRLRDRRAPTGIVAQHDPVADRRRSQGIDHPAEPRVLASPTRSLGSFDRQPTSAVDSAHAARPHRLGVAGRESLVVQRRPAQLAQGLKPSLVRHARAAYAAPVRNPCGGGAQRREVFAGAVTGGLRREISATRRRGTRRVRRSRPTAPPAAKEPTVINVAPDGRRQPLFRGAGVALLTLFDRDGSMLVDQTAQFAASRAENGADAILVAGTTGEFWTLTASERLTLVEAVRAAVSTDTPVIAGIGALDTTRTLELAAAVGRTGADAALCFVPRDADPTRIFPQLREAVGDLPLLAYHFPAAGYTPLPVDQLPALHVDGIKDSSGDPTRLVATGGVLTRGVYTGSALLCSLACSIQIDGVILALANAAPDSAHEAAGGSLTAQGELARLHGRIGGGSPPTALKAHLAERVGIPPWTRGVALADAT